MLVMQQTRRCLMPRNAKFPSQNTQHCQLAKTEGRFPVSSQPCSGDQTAPNASRLLCGFTSWLAAPCGSTPADGDSGPLAEPGLQPEVPGCELLSCRLGGQRRGCCDG